MAQNDDLGGVPGFQQPSHERLAIFIFEPQLSRLQLDLASSGQRYLLGHRMR